MEKITDALYREMGRLVDDSMSENGVAKAYFEVETEGREYLFSFRACGACSGGICLLFAALRPLYHDCPNDFSKSELEKYVWKIETA